MGLVVNATLRPLHPRETYPLPIVQEAGWSLGPLWTRAENLGPAAIRSPGRQARSESHVLHY